MFCEKCGTTIAEGQATCPNCGASAVTAPKSKKINPIIHVILGVLIVGIVACIVIMLVSTKVTYKEQELDVQTEEDVARESVEVKSPNVQQLNLSVLSTIASEPVAEAEPETETLETESEYIFEDSDSRFLEEDEIYALTQEEMRIARNEIYARLGRKFTDEALQEYFDSKSWYAPLLEPEEFDELGDDIFNEYEFANKNLIAEIEKELGYN